MAVEEAVAQEALRAPRRIREVPESYFLKRPPLWVSLARAGLAVSAGLATAVWLEGWIKQKIAEDGGYVIVLGKKKDTPSEE
ncbi:hypothetical protein KFL_006800070 [Klebsormidium nitens]|uniref:Uncharacterized protein n=1 Tax=Klebsormidium nitens TaxID=105231 RepID=A0A1Y1IKT3_KLENI|nr:hypothetical protein KFL_006800070 [Klebsormidium nitens]|eukprot:GAQ90752.1 hypothetical protein KFL_006800070 [Klebsormidium nitens]